MGVDGRHLAMSFSSRGWEFYPRKLPSLVLNCSQFLSKSSILKQVEPDVDIFGLYFIPSGYLLSSLIQAQFKNFFHSEWASELRKKPYKSLLVPCSFNHNIFMFKYQLKGTYYFLETIILLLKPNFQGIGLMDQVTKMNLWGWNGESWEESRRRQIWNLRLESSRTLPLWGSACALGLSASS